MFRFPSIAIDLQSEGGDSLNEDYAGALQRTGLHRLNGPYQTKAVLFRKPAVNTVAGERITLGPIIPHPDLRHTVPIQIIRQQGFPRTAPFYLHAPFSHCQRLRSFCSIHKSLIRPLKHGCNAKDGERQDHHGYHDLNETEPSLTQTPYHR